MPKGIRNTPRTAPVISASRAALEPAGETKRATRADEVRQERRKRPGSSSQVGIRLGVDESKLDRNTYAYRFVNDRDGRVQRLEAQDWDIAPELAKSDSNSVGTINSAHGGVDEGKPFNTVLMRKRKDWFETDQKEKQRPLDETENAIRRGADHKANSLRGEGVYTPENTNAIEVLSSR